MAEKQIFFNAGKIKIEGLFDDLAGDKGVVISHPHPLYGGDMYSNVVEAICRAYREKGYSTLRFNFRGAGRSEGSYDSGIGEQVDVQAALAYLSEAGKRQIDLAGYSFGAWVNVCGLDKFETADRMIMVSPPVSAIDFSFLTYHPKIRLVIVGAEDHIADPGALEKMVQTWNPAAILKLIPGADHFYWGKDHELVSILHEFLSADKEAVS